jgi:lipoprotein-anchoring transpeptidase ErfK/SrfK
MKTIILFLIGLLSFASFASAQEGRATSDSIYTTEMNLPGSVHVISPSLPSGYETWSVPEVQDSDKKISVIDNNRSSVQWVTGRPEDNGFASYSIRKGDTLRKLTMRMSLGQEDRFVELVLKINRRDERHFPKVGQSVLVPICIGIAEHYAPIPENNPNPRGEREVIVFLDSQYAGAYQNGKLQFWYPVSTGKTGHETEPGKYSVNWKAGKDHVSSIDPSWKMPYAVNFTGAGKAIHEQELPGYEASHGCARTSRNGAMAFHDFLRIHDPITIIGKSPSAKAMMSKN